MQANYIVMEITAIEHDTRLWHYGTVPSGEKRLSL